MNLPHTSDLRFYVPTGNIDPLTPHQRVRKVSGDYRYPGVVVGIIKTTAGKERLLVEATGKKYKGMLHVFAPEQMEPVDD